MKKYFILILFGFVLMIPSVQADVYGGQYYLTGGATMTDSVVEYYAGIYRTTWLMQSSSMSKLSNNRFVFKNPPVFSGSGGKDGYFILSAAFAAGSRYTEVDTMNISGYFQPTIHYKTPTTSAYIPCTVIGSNGTTASYKCPFKSDYQSVLDLNFVATMNDSFYKYGSFSIIFLDALSYYFFDSNSDVSSAIKDQTDQQHKDSQAQLEESKKQTEEQKKQTEFITSDDEPDSDISALGNVTGIFPPGPVDSLLNIPFKVGSIVVSSLSGTCVPLSGTWAFNEPFTIPCFSEVIYDDMDGPLSIFVDLIPGAFILICYFKHLYKKVDRAVSLETTTDDEWGVI